MLPHCVAMYSVKVIFTCSSFPSIVTAGLLPNLLRVYARFISVSVVKLAFICYLTITPFSVEHLIRLSESCACSLGGLFHTAIEFATGQYSSSVNRDRVPSTSGHGHMGSKGINQAPSVYATYETDARFVDRDNMHFKNCNAIDQRLPMWKFRTTIIR